MKVILGADISEFTKAMNTVKSSTKGATDSVKKGFSGITSGIGGLVKGFGKIAGATGAFKLVSAGMNLISQSFDSAISRVDTLKQFPKVLQQMGYSAEDAESATTRLAEGIKGLPTTLDGIVGSTQRMVTIFGDVDMATESALALNNAFLASGASQADASRGLDQYIQMLSAGKVDMQSWRTLQETMPYALQKTAEAFGFTGKSAQNDFYQALQEGDVTFDQFNSKMIELSNETGGFAEVALEASKGIKTSWGNIKTAIATGIANIITAFDSWLDSKGFGGIAGVLDIIKGAVQDTFNVIVEWVPKALGAFDTLQAKVADSTAWNSLKSLVEAGMDAIQGLWDKFKDTGTLEKAKEILVELGEILLEIDFMKIAKDVGSFLDKWSPLIAGIAGAIGTFKVITALISLWNGVVVLAGAVVTGFGAALAFITSPIGIIVIAVGALIAIGVALYKNWDTVKGFLIGIWNNIKDVCQTVFEGIGQFLTNSWNSIQDVAKSVFGAIGQFFSDVWEKIKSVFSTSVEFISNIITVGFLLVKSIIEGVLLVIQAIFQTYWNIYKAIVETVFNIIKSVIENVLNIIKTIISAIWEQIGGVVTTVLTAIQTVISTVWNAIKDVITTVVTAIQEVISTIWNAIKDTVLTVVNAIKDVVTTVWNAIKNTMTTILNAVKGVVTTVWNAIKTVTSTVFNAIKTVATSVWNGIKTLVTSVVNALKTAVQTAWNAISSVTSSVFNTVKSVATSVWNGIKSAITTVVNGVKTTVSNVWNSIKSTTSSVFNSIKSTATSVWNGVKSAITTPIESAKNKIKGIVDAIKGFFSGMKLSIPKISMPPLPHFTISGSFSLKPPSVPKLGLSWYETGGIATGPSVVGIGENGDEAILPLSNKSRMAPFASAVASMLDTRGKDDSGSGGDTIITGNHFVVREEADINKIAQELHRIEQRERRGKGKNK